MYIHACPYIYVQFIGAPPNTEFIQASSTALHALLQESSQLTFDLLLRLPSLCTWRGVEGREVSVLFVSREKAFNIQHVNILVWLSLYDLYKEDGVYIRTSYRELEHEEMLTTTSIVCKHVRTYVLCTKYKVYQTALTNFLLNRLLMRTLLY